MTTTILAYLYAICAIVIWNGSFIVAWGLSESIPPISLAFYGQTLAGKDFKSRI